MAAILVVRVGLIIWFSVPLDMLLVTLGTIFPANHTTGTNTCFPQPIARLLLVNQI